MNDLCLYSYWRSSASWRVRIALELKEIDYTYHSVHLVEGGGEQHSDTYQEINPMSQVPTLTFVDQRGEKHFLTQSMAIISWLDSSFPDPRLIPDDPLLKARAIQYAEVINAGIQPLQNLNVLQNLKKTGVQNTKRWARRYIQKGLQALDKMASETAGKFLLGPSVSIADLCLVPQIYNARRFEVDLSEMKYLLMVSEKCEALPAFQRAHPSAQPDAVQ